MVEVVLFAQKTIKVIYPRIIAYIFLRKMFYNQQGEGNELNVFIGNYDYMPLYELIVVFFSLKIVKKILFSIVLVTFMLPFPKSGLKQNYKVEERCK